MVFFPDHGAKKFGRLWELAIVPISTDSMEISLRDWKMASQIPLQVFTVVRDNVTVKRKRDSAMVSDFCDDLRSKLLQMQIQEYQNFLQGLSNDELKNLLFKKRKI